jgi:hypothetical protein
MAKILLDEGRAPTAQTARRGTQNNPAPADKGGLSESLLRVLKTFLFGQNAKIAVKTPLQHRLRTHLGIETK